ncbi:MAG: phenylacetic acid degradation bifunctional protein PaaZ [Candidatus Angelobacter sp.]|nr:phenylacetic acid degradation bifunctional protein PaaZ [Candidatus Angelobacter sp.]
MSSQTEPIVVQSYLSGKWQSGSDRGTALVNPTDGSTIAFASSKGLDLGAALDYSRRVGGSELRKLGYAQRAALLGKIADVLAAKREQWFEIARKNSGNTKADAGMDVDGSIGTLKYFAKVGAALGDSNALADGAPARLARDPNFQGLHIGIPMSGVAVHINAFNFPGWGLWEKAAVTLLSGMPVFAKPATSTCWLAKEMVASVIDAGILPDGSLSILCGAPNDLLDHLQFGDVVAFTGSASTGQQIRQHPRIQQQGVRVNIEADSLNAALLGPDVADGSASSNFFVREVVREMTLKAGQKCTAIRRVLVPADRAAGVAAALVTALSEVKVGNPENAAVGMGPVVNAQQRKSVEEGIKSLSKEASIRYRPAKFTPVDADPHAGAFVPPTLFEVGNASQSALVNDLEVFGPVATIVPYRDKVDSFDIARRGGGSLAVSVFSADTNYLADAATALGSSHGRVLLVDPSIGDSHTGHGVVLPSLLHGGPGRAGGGEELGGLHGMWLYHQRVAVQGSGTTLTAIAGRAVEIPES